MSSRYTEVDRVEFEDFVNYLGFKRIIPGHVCRELVYECKLSVGTRIRIYSTLTEEYGVRGKGNDAIRVVCVSGLDDIFYNTKRVHRTQNWRKSILNRIDTIYEEMPQPKVCTECDDGILLPKKGKFGDFLGCSNYPNCRNTQQIRSDD